MLPVRGLALAALLAASIAAALLPEAAARPDQLAPEPTQPAADGAALYDRYCLACHGQAGDGRGPATPWLWPRPRDFTRGEFKWRTTASGQAPTDADLELAIRSGVPGTSMHGFAGALADGDIAALVAVVQGFAPTRFAARPKPVAVGSPPPVDQALLDRGAQAYATYGCNQCHGAALRGDGASVPTLVDAAGVPAPPFDLTTRPLRRPRDGDDGLRAIYLDLLTGLDGTSMPSYASLPADDLWAMAAWIDARRWRPGRGPASPPGIDPIAQRLDRTGKLTAAGQWPGHGTGEEQVFPRAAIPPQGPPPRSLAPAQASLDSARCARCHAEQYERWSGSIHARALTEGMLAQIVEQEAAGRPGFAAPCQRCHAPLAEQLAGAPGYDAALRGEGVTCASCHLRSWQRHGPPRSPGARLLPLPGYPLRQMAVYERSDLCLPCHQLPARLSVADRPLLDTYREWLMGPYMPRGVQCQHCHMPGRQHSFKGVHDPDTFRQGIKLEAIAGRSARTGAVSVRARLRNVGAGHHLPTTPTPAAWLIVELVDDRGRPIDGARAEKRIGRHIEFTAKGGFRDLEDTRIPAGGSVELADAWTGGRVPAARHARVSVRVHPDDYYELFYSSRLRRTLPAEARALYQKALDRARGNRYLAIEQLVPIAPPERP